MEKIGMTEIKKHHLSTHKELTIKIIAFGILLSFLIAFLPFYSKGQGHKKNGPTVPVENWVHGGYSSFSKGSFGDNPAIIYFRPPSHKLSGVWVEAFFSSTKEFV